MEWEIERLTSSHLSHGSLYGKEDEISTDEKGNEYLFNPRNSLQKLVELTEDSEGSRFVPEEIRSGPFLSAIYSPAKRKMQELRGIKVGKWVDGNFLHLRYCVGDFYCQSLMERSGGGGG